MTTHRAGDEERVRGNDEVRSLRRACHLRAGLLRSDGWWQRIEGEDGLGLWEHRKTGLRLIHSIAAEADDEIWAHVSLSRLDRKLPTWEQVVAVKQLLYPELVALQVLAPAAEWVSLAEVHHIWICLTRRPTPDFRSRETGVL